MCGIAGLITRDLDVSRAREVAGAMTRTMVHRGPDGEGVYSWASDGLAVALGHRRLSIIDLSDEAAQPFEDASRDSALTFNGEIYNYRALATPSVVAKCETASRSDTAALATILAEQWTSALPQLRGIFAFAAWDGARRRLMLARDQFGVKPLYWARVGRTTLFASEVRAILASGLVDRSLDWTGLYSHLMFGSPIEPRTLVRGIRSVAPATSIEIDERLNVREAQWWSLPAAVDAIRREGESGSVRERLTDAVAAQMVADVPVGIFLSGGVDSTALAIEATRTGARPAAVSLFFRGSALSEETPVRETAQRFDLDVHAATLDAEDVANALQGWLDAQDQPSIDGFNTFLVSRLARTAGLKVALSGLGGDEVFGGYSGYTRARRATRLAQFGRRVGAPSFLRMAPRMKSARTSRLLDLFSGQLPAYFVSRSLHGRASARALLCNSEGGVQLESVCETPEGIAAEPSLVRRLAMLEAWFYMTNVLLRDADQMGMAHSLEIRVPLLDPALAATAVWGLGDSFPASAVAKPSLVHAVRDDHLTSLASRRKRGFTLPLASWLREPRGLTALRALASESAGGMFAFAPNSVRTSIDRFQSQGDGVYSMLALVTAGRWIARHGVTA